MSGLLPQMRSVFLFLTCCIVNCQAQQIDYLVVENLAQPFQINDRHISNGGIISDIVDLIFADSHYDVVHKVFPVKRITRMVETKKVKNWITYDAKVWNAMSEWGNFVEEPLFSVNHTYLTCYHQPEQINNGKDLKGMDINILEGFDYPELNALKQKELIKLFPVRSYLRAFNLVELKRISAFVEMEFRIRFHLLRNQINSGCFRFVDMSKIIPAYNIFLTIDKNSDKKLKNFVESRLRELKKAGELERIYNHYIYHFQPQDLGAD